MLDHHLDAFANQKLEEIMVDYSDDSVVVTNMGVFRVFEFDTQSQFPGQRIQAGPIVWDDPVKKKEYVAIAANQKIYVLSGG